MAAAERRNGAHLIAVERRARPAGEAEVRSLIDALDERPGAWLGCDVAAEGLYAKHSIGCVDPALGFYLDGATLKVLAFNETGARLLPAVRQLGAFEALPGGLRARFQGQSHLVVQLLRKFLALFAPAHAELGLYGAWSFDYFKLAHGGLPDDGRRRFVLYFPERVLTSAAEGAQWIEFAFTGLPEAPPDIGRPIVEAPRLDGETDELPPGGHAQRVAQGIELLRSGELASLVLSQTFRRRVGVKGSAAFHALRALNPYPAMLFLNLGGGEKLFGASPDLQVRAEGDLVESAPVCGTVRRGADPLADVAQALALLASDKEAAALSGCADSDCNDKAQVCIPGSVELVSHRRVHYFSTIVHTIAHTRGRRRAGVDGFDVLLAHAAPATVAGVPKQQALRAIERLEPSWRGWYAGAAARIGCDGSVEAYTILRAARIVGELAEVRTGGNILVDSDPASEEDETRLKAETLFRVLQGAAPDRERSQGARSRPVTHRVRLRNFGDPFLPLLLDGLARAEIALDEKAAITLLTMGFDVETRVEMPAERLLAIGTAAIAVLAADGARAERLPCPRYARSAEVHAERSGFLAGMSSMRVGLYAARRIEADALPAPWRCIARDAEGYTLAAVDEASRRCALLFRPDSILSLGNSAGVRALRAALDWLAG